MSPWAAFFVGIAIGFFFAATLMGLLYRRELEDRDEWEREARSVLREVGLTSHYPGWLRERAKRLLADEAGA